MDARTIARALGGDVVNRSCVLAPGPGHSRQDRSLSIKIEPNAPGGLLVFSHAGDDPLICKDYVRRSLRLPKWQPGDERNRTIPSSRVNRFDNETIEAEIEKGPREWNEDEIERIASAREMWNKGVDPRDTLAQQYLNKHRKLELPDHLAGSVLRFHPRCPWRNENTGQTEYVPALIAPFRSVDNDAITGIHRIALNADASKRGRRMLGIVERAAIKFDAINNRELCIGEGIETCLAGRQLGYAPTWAVGSVGAISFFPVIDGVKLLKIFGEAGEASAKAIRICGTRWTRAFRRVRIVTPKNGANDLNDTLMQEAVS